MPAQAGIQYSETPAMEAKTRGVLDTRFRGYDAGGVEAGTTICPDAGASRREVEKLCQQASQSILVGEQVLTSTSPIAISNPPGTMSGFLALDWNSG
jgi:hypothetical protein